MTTLQKIINAGLALGLVAVGFIALSSGSKFGGASTYETYPTHWLKGLYAGTLNQLTIDANGNISTTGTFQLGSSGTLMTNHVIANAASGCTVVADNSIAATSTGYAYATGCTGITSTDLVSATFGTSTLGYAVTDQWVIANAVASSTAGKVDLEILNLTGAARAPSAASRTASSTIIRASH